ncbi:MAG: TonB-dependent receptor [Bacteroidales bacterium]|nr:TonB-dependent receptor [Bacteroidales bacterium]
MSILYIAFGNVTAQNMVSAFKVYILSENEPVVGCVVAIPQLNRVTVSDTEGYAVFADVPEGRWAVTTQYLGFLPENKEFSVPSENAAEIQLQQQSYLIDDVVVVAKSGSDALTSSRIDRTALEHQQTVSVADALQLLPGQTTKNPSLNSPALLTVREIDTNDASAALGTALVVDGIGIDNDANMQIMSTSKVASTEVPVSAGTGIDVRSIPSDRIESVEVVRGVASAEYGNMTSGMVLVNTRAGAMPFSAMLKTDPLLKSVSLAKGFKISKKGAALSIDSEFAVNKQDERVETQKFRRFTAQVAYSDVVGIGTAKLMLNMKLNGFAMKNVEDSDPDMLSDEYVRVADRQLSASVTARLIANKPYLTSLSMSAFASVGRQKSESLISHVAQMSTPYTYSMTNGEHEGAFYPNTYAEKKLIDGRPLNINVKAVAKISKDKTLWGNMLSFGGELSVKGNKGDGKSGEYLPTGYRPRPFSDIPFVYDCAFFAEDKYRAAIGAVGIELQAGARFTKVVAEGYNFKLRTEPRINALLKIIDNQSVKLTMTGAWGIQTKMPTLVHLYPDPAYLDQISYTYVDNDRQKSKAVFTSLVLDDNRNANLALPENRKIEIGIKLKINKLNIETTYFNESMRDGFAFRRRIAPLTYRVYNQTVEQANYESGGLNLSDGSAVGFYTDTTFLNYNSPDNSLCVDKQGVEYTIDFGKIKRINTQFILDGAFFDIKKTDDSDEYYYQPGIIKSRNRKYAAVSKSASTSYNSSRKRRLNSSLRIITRIPLLGLVTTLKCQCVWIDKMKRDYIIDGKSMICRADDGSYYVNPIALVDQSGRVISDLPADLAKNSQTNVYVNYLGTNALREDNPKPYAMCDIRLTKEIGNNLFISFYANNFTNSRPERYFASSDVYIRKNTEIYFGCDFKFKL